MADQYGALQIPVQTKGPAPPAVIAGGDPLLGWVGDFLQAVLNTNAITAWQEIAPGTNPVAFVRLTNPVETLINSKDLPALYIFRDENVDDQSIEWFASDYRYKVSTVHVWWVMPDGAPDKDAIRYAFPNAIDKVIDQAIERGRDPSWVVTGDTDPQAATSGSVLSRYAGWDVFGLKKARHKTLKIMAEGAPPRLYRALMMEFHCEELLQPDLSLVPAMAGVQATFQSPDQGTGLGPLDLGSQDYT